MRIKVWIAGIAAAALGAAAFVGSEVQAGKPGGGGGGGGTTNYAIAYTQNGKICRVKSDGSGLTSWIASTRCLGLAWAGPRSDGPARFAYLAEVEPGTIWRELWTAHEDGASSSRQLIGAWHALAPAGSPPLPDDGNAKLRWMPDGERIVYMPYRWNLDEQSEPWVIDVRTKAGYAIRDEQGRVLPRQWHAFDGMGEIRHTSPSPDLDASAAGYQGWLAYSARRRSIDASGQQVASSYDVWVVRLYDGPDGNLRWAAPAGGGEPARLVLDATDESSPEWGSDGRSLVFQANNADGERTLGVVAFDPVAGAIASSWSQSAAIAGLDVSLTDDFGLALSPDGAWLAAVRWVRPSPISICRVRPDGTGLVDVVKSKNTNSDDTYYPVWNPRWVNDIGQ